MCVTLQMKRNEMEFNLTRVLTVYINHELAGLLEMNDMNDGASPGFEPRPLTF